ncbi:phytoene/squalene synthase family protein [Reichenbachiella carrageenanivorans]|uniref:Phytoene/squalene synthase family protein n=1 Tax=Reichenbachiella carrageenanivorans TaxID=2979869 RepID=A0ABY6CWK1_9BACT|nr:phytoene/squalene synthase family protein [Reichenbachiella carrageenanivorans]UXX78248.1 phytoene/squalene synthase family protein [Reichenbachiella carrageenanivorans]
MKHIYDEVALATSKLITRKYSTSFSLGIYFLDRKIHNDIYAIYGFVRLADEIVDSFEGFDQKGMMDEIRQDTQAAIHNKISINPVLNAFQDTVNQYNIEWELIDTFLKSMEMDLTKAAYDAPSFDTYVLGSAEVVGLMCLRVFTNNDTQLYESLKEPAMKLGSAFQKVNFLRDLKADYEVLGRSYFPEIDLASFSDTDKTHIENGILADFNEALVGIKRLPKCAKLGVYLAYIYYRSLFKKISKLSPNKVMHERIRIPNYSKFGLMFDSIIRYKLNIM